MSSGVLLVLILVLGAKVVPTLIRFARLAHLKRLWKGNCSSCWAATSLACIHSTVILLGIQRDVFSPSGSRLHNSIFIHPSAKRNQGFSNSPSDS